MSTLTHVIGYNTNLSVRTILLLVTAKLAGAVLSVAPLVHPRAVLTSSVTTVIMTEQLSPLAWRSLLTGLSWAEEATTSRKLNKKSVG